MSNTYSKENRRKTTCNFIILGLIDNYIDGGNYMIYVFNWTMLDLNYLFISWLWITGLINWVYNYFRNNMEQNIKRQQPLMVTIRCCAYNQEAYIRDCLEGFVMQRRTLDLRRLCMTMPRWMGRLKLLRSMQRSIQTSSSRY